MEVNLDIVIMEINERLSKIENDIQWFKNISWIFALAFITVCGALVMVVAGG